jgi:hypothetical protein
MSLDATSNLGIVNICVWITGFLLHTIPFRRWTKMLRPRALDKDSFPRNCTRAVAPSMCSVHDFIDRGPPDVLTLASC